MANSDRLGFIDRTQKEWSGFSNRMSRFGTSLQGSAMGRAAVRGAGMAAGFGYNEKGISTGFLGWRSTAIGGRYTEARAGKIGRFQSATTAFRDSARALGQAGPLGGTKAVAKGASKMLGAALPGAFTAYQFYEGYQEGGVWGGIKGAAEGVAMNAAFEMATTALGGAFWPLAIIAAGGYAGYRFADAARDYGRNLKKINMGAPAVDMFGTIATTRQRSLMALQNTHINGRMALGNEAMLMHTNIYSRY